MPRIKPVFFIVFILLSRISISQNNLVPNGSFEKHDSCDCSFNNVNDWFIGIVSPDYFNECTSSVCGIPSNGWGNINPKEGQAYIGEALWFNNSISREFIYTKIDTLEKGDKYCLSFYISVSNQSAYYCNNISALFTNLEIGSTLINYFNYQPQITNVNKLKGEFDWQKIEGEFIADGTEQFLYLGNFTQYDQSECYKISDNDTMIFSNGYYAFIDDVQLVKCNNWVSPNVFSPNNDELNDIIDFNNHYVKKVTILNRWGNEVFCSSETNKIWNGKDKLGNDLSEGIYYYLIELENESKTGYIHLIR